MTLMKTNHSLWTATRIALLVLMWGVSFAVYKVSLSDTPPILFAGLRTFLGGVFLAALAWPSRREIHLRKNWRVYLISSLFNVILFFGLQTVGLSYLPAGLFSVVMYLEPVLVGLFAWLWLGESMTWLKIVGLLLGFGGVATISAGSFQAHLSLPGIVIGVVTAFVWTVGTIYSKKAQERVNMMWLLAIQFTFGGLVLTGVGSAAESWSAIVWGVPLWTGLAFGMVIGCSVSWILWFALVHEGEASRVAAFTFMVPLLSVIIATIFLGEPVTWTLGVGLACIVAGIYLVNRRSRPNRPRRSRRPRGMLPAVGATSTHGDDAVGE